MDDITKINNNANLSRYLDRIQDTPYKPAHKKMLTDLINYAVDHDWTLRTLADKLPVSTTVMHRLLIGAYQAPTGPHLSKLDDLCGLLALRQQSASDGPFIETALARYVMQIAELTHVNQYASMLVGKTQWGKTWALKEYARRHPGTVIMVRCPVVTSPGRLLYRIAAQLGLSVKGNTEFQIAKIVNRLTPEHLLIVDEIHHALDSDKTGRKGIEQLREIYDETQCGMLLVGTPVLAEYVEKMTSGKASWSKPPSEGRPISTASRTISRPATWKPCGLITAIRPPAGPCWPPSSSRPICTDSARPPSACAKGWRPPTMPGWTLHGTTTWPPSENLKKWKPARCRNTYNPPPQKNHAQEDH